MKIVKQALSIALLMCVSGLALANSATAQLRDFINQVHAATGQFTQSTIDSNGSSKAAQQGNFAFQRQGQFRWETTQPYEQLVLSDGKQVYQYDADLMQVTKRGVDAAIGASPAAILFGSGNLDDAFKLTDLPNKDGLEWLQAVPKSSDAGFAHVNIGFKNKQPVRIELLDSFAQTTRIELKQLQAKTTLDPALFIFRVPQGVDVVTMP